MATTVVNKAMYILPFIDILYAAHVCERRLPDDGYDG
jgi:hypothetical protein